MQSKRRVPRIITIAITIIILLCLTAVFGEWYLGKKGYGYRELESPRAHDYISTEGPSSRPKRAMCLGCSFTAGVGIPLEDNYVSQLNNLRPDCSFDNCGEPATEVFAALQHATWRMQKRQYNLVTYAIIDKHLNRPPFCRVIIDGKIMLEPNPYTGKTVYYANDYPIIFEGKEHKMTINLPDYYLPGSQYSRLLSFYSNLRLHSQELNNQNTVSKSQETKMAYLIRALYTCAQKHGAKFAVIALNKFAPITKEFTELPPIEYFAKSKLTPNDIPIDIPTLDASYPVDIMSKPELHTVKAPLDRNGDHPSALVHKYYAERISELIKKEHLLD